MVEVVEHFDDHIESVVDVVGSEVNNLQYSPKCCTHQENLGWSMNSVFNSCYQTNKYKNTCLGYTINCLFPYFFSGFLNYVTEPVTLFLFFSPSLNITGIPHDDIDQCVLYEAAEDKDGAGIHEHVNGFDVGYRR